MHVPKSTREHAMLGGQVYIAEQAYFARGGPRLVDGVEMLARMVHPGAAPRRCLEGTVLKLSLHVGQRCRPRMLATYFQSFQ